MTPSILLVEDDPSDQIIIEKKIKSLWPECGLKIADTLKDAEELFEKHSFQIVVLDLNLPDSFGAESVEKMRSINQNIQIIVLTGALSPDVAHDSLTFGANNIFPKSDLLDNDDFFNILEESLERAKAA